MIITSTNDIKGYKITQYLGLINVNVVIGANFFSDFFASFTDVFGGYSDTYQSKLDKIYGDALRELTKKAEGKGSDTYKTEDGRMIEFHSSMGAVNWFVSNGWKLESEHLALSNDRCVKMYVVSKEVPLEQVKAKANNYIKK